MFLWVHANDVAAFSFSDHHTSISQGCKREAYTYNSYGFHMLSVEEEKDGTTTVSSAEQRNLLWDVEELTGSQASSRAEGEREKVRDRKC